MTLMTSLFVSCKKENIKQKDSHQIQLNCDNNIIALVNYTDENGVKHTNQTVDKKVFTVDWNEEFEIKSTTVNITKFILVDLTVKRQPQILINGELVTLLDSVTTNNYFFKN